MFDFDPPWWQIALFWAVVAVLGWLVIEGLIWLFSHLAWV